MLIFTIPVAQLRTRYPYAFPSDNEMKRDGERPSDVKQPEECLILSQWGTNYPLIFLVPCSFNIWLAHPRRVAFLFRRDRVNLHLTSLMREIRAYKLVEITRNSGVIVPGRFITRFKSNLMFWYCCLIAWNFGGPELKYCLSPIVRSWNLNCKITSY